MEVQTREKKVRAKRDLDGSESRPRRIPVSGNRDILTIRNKEDGFHYRWVLDQGMRVPKFIDGGYEVAPDNGLIVGDARTGVPSQYGSAVIATSKEGSTLILMRIKSEWFKEDQDAKAEEIQQTLDSMAQLEEGQYGSTGIIKSR